MFAEPLAHALADHDRCQVDVGARALRHDRRVGDVTGCRSRGRGGAGRRRPSGRSPAPSSPCRTGGSRWRRRACTTTRALRRRRWCSSDRRQQAVVQVRELRRARRPRAPCARLRRAACTSSGCSQKLFSMRGCTCGSADVSVTRPARLLALDDASRSSRPARRRRIGICDDGHELHVVALFAERRRVAIRHLHERRVGIEDVRLRGERRRRASDGRRGSRRRRAGRATTSMPCSRRCAAGPSPTASGSPAMPIAPPASTMRSPSTICVTPPDSTSTPSRARHR